MFKFDKWLGASVGYMIGGPIGGFFGYMAAENNNSRNYQHTAHTSEFETSLLLLLAEVIVADGKVAESETAFVRKFFATHFDEKYIDEKTGILYHCIEKKYDSKKACDELRHYCNHTTRMQIVHLLFEVAIADGALVKAELDLIFKLAGWLNINDIDFKKIKATYSQNVNPKFFILLEVKPTDDFDTIKTAYRKMVLRYHPDKHTDKTTAEQNQMASKLQAIQQAYEEIKKIKENKL